MYTPALLSLALASCSFALPTLKARAGPSCAGIGGGAFDVAHNFTLYAYNSTTSNTNSTGVPLVVGQAGSTENEESKVLSTYASYPYNDWPNFSLVNGALIPNSGSSSSAAAADSNVTAGNEPGFIVADPENLPQAAEIYCGVADTDPNQGSRYPLLAVNGNTDSFSLCMSGSGARAQNNVVYLPSSDNSGVYDYSSCYPVHLHMVGLD
ncbi:hypothetical protein AcW1_003076 [Taiwanofungus camphoratus]|nr:hypothetical protein AcV5_001734 [Antrodia cinnamomea]KAI0933307.1 hypothetical protein AcV7_004814 [Antrodia cinnamomea]KAI0942444.1 hypothetical protein AcW1_003076 [Antrodia cinnamomea]